MGSGTVRKRGAVRPLVKAVPQRQAKHPLDPEQFRPLPNAVLISIGQTEQMKMTNIAERLESLIV